ncbi:MAG: glycosyltransferase [Cyanobacteria bacterium P01_F01_bin.33]
MKIGYLHLGPPQNGICRYGRMLASAAEYLDNISVLNIEVPERDRIYSQNLVAQIIHQAAQVDAIHIQWSLNNNSDLWGMDFSQIRLFNALFKKIECPLFITIHDVYALPTLAYFVSKAKKYVTRSPGKKVNARYSQDNDSLSSSNLPKEKSSKLIKLSKSIKYFRKLFTQRIALMVLDRRACSFFVASQEEASRFEGVIDASKVKVVPHFVEIRDRLPLKEDARHILGFNDSQIIVTILGFIHPRKGHAIAIEALSELPENYTLVIAGGVTPDPDSKDYLTYLQNLISKKNLDDRVTITGYLNDDEFEQFLAATDIAVCPFKTFSASGSLSSWISAGVRTIAFSLPQIEEYNSLVHGSIRTFSSYSAEALAKVIIEESEVARKEEKKLEVMNLANKLSIKAIIKQHADFYAQVLPANQRFDA